MSRKCAGDASTGVIMLADTGAGEAPPAVAPKSWHCPNPLPGEVPWGDLPVLDKVFDLLTDIRDVAACACVCRGWRAEAADDRRWKEAWARQVSEFGLWRWARAEGGYREQLRANALTRKGDCVASVFPLNRRDGPVSEVLLLDAAPAPRVLTVHHRRMPSNSVRLVGATIKVWDAAALGSQRPLLVIHDVVKHLQLEDGSLFCWRVAEHCTIRVRGQAGLAAGDGEGEEPDDETARWTEDPGLLASVLDVAALELRDVALESTYGRGRTPFEFMDGGAPALLAAAGACPEADTIDIRLFDLASGRCFRASEVRLPDVGADVMPLQPLMLMSRNSEPVALMLAAAALFDCRVFLWFLRDEWLAPAARENSAAENAALDAAAAAERAAAAAPRGDGSPSPPPAEPPTDPDTHRLHHVFTTPAVEPIVDLSISSAANRIYVLCTESLFVLDGAGRAQMAIAMTSWRGVAPLPPLGGSFDVGAFSWPLPNSTRAAFYLDATGALFVGDFRGAQLDEMWNVFDPGANAIVPGRYPALDHLRVWRTDGEGNLAPGTANMFLQCHNDLRPPQRSPHATTLAGRATRPADAEQVIVEYVQSGDVLFTGADASCAAPASLLRAERAAGTYLPGLGPGAAAGRGAAAARRGPFISRPRGESVPVAPRALVCIDTRTGRRYKAIPVEGAIEAVHAAGHYVAMAVAPLGGAGRSDGALGSIVVVDFSKEGFGETTEQRAERKAAAAAAAAAAQAAGKMGSKGRRAPAKADVKKGGAGRGGAGGKGSGQSQPKRRRG